MAAQGLAGLIAEQPFHVHATQLTRNRPAMHTLHTLHTPRCTLEPLMATHAEAMFAVLSDPAIYEFENSPPMSLPWLHQRYQRLEARCAPDASERWLNWAVRLPGGALAGVVQATVLPSGAALVGYELASAFWRQGIASAAVAAMLDELARAYRVHTALAVLKARNHRSAGLLLRLGFLPGTPTGLLPDAMAAVAPEADEINCHKPLGMRPAT